MLPSRKAGAVAVVLATLLGVGCGRRDGSFTGALGPGSRATSADLSAFEPYEVRRLQYMLARCSGGLFSGSSDCKLTYWELNAGAKKEGVDHRQLVFRMHGYPEEGRAFPVLESATTASPFDVSIEYLEFPKTRSENELPPTWKATAGTLTTRNVSERGFEYELADVDFGGELTATGRGTLDAPAKAPDGG